MSFQLKLEHHSIFFNRDIRKSFGARRELMAILWSGLGSQVMTHHPDDRAERDEAE